MRQIVRDSFFDFTSKREGFTPFMYCDTLNLVTTGVGNLIDSGARNGFDTSANAMAPAMGLPWKIKGTGWTSSNPVVDGPASQDQVRSAWVATKLQEQVSPGFNKQGGFAYKNLTNVSLDMQGLKDLFARTLTNFDNVLKTRYPSYENWPADAQLAILSMSWAMGPAFDFPQFRTSANAEDFQTIVNTKSSFFKGGGGTLEAPAGRNAENLTMFQTAANVVKSGANRDELHFTKGTQPSGGPANIFVAQVKTDIFKSPAVKSGAIAVGSAAATAGATFGLWKLLKHLGWL